MGNLSFDLDTDQLRKFFEKWGPISDCFLPQDRTTQKPRGFGFVTFRDAADAKLAVSQADGTELDGRQLRVTTEDPALPSEDSTESKDTRCTLPIIVLAAPFPDFIIPPAEKFRTSSKNCVVPLFKRSATVGDGAPSPFG